MKLIADSGSTKTQWALIDVENPGQSIDFTTVGINPTLMSSHELEAALGSSLSQLNGKDIDEIHFYGAGCTPQVCDLVKDALRKITNASAIEVASDMLGAARGLCGTSPGIVAILGTGSNSCFYDGEKIVGNTPPLGYILGDEGSGSRLGICLVNGVFKGYFPESFCKAFHDTTGLDKAAIIERVYRQPSANVFLASLVPFIVENKSHQAIQSMVADEFQRFFKHNILHAYPKGLPVNFVGSIAVEFEEILREVARGNGLEVGRIVRRPLPLMVEYHRRNN